MLLVDNGPPWGGRDPEDLTSLVIWLIRLRIRLIHSSPSHPQTLGKDERFHRTLKQEVLYYGPWKNLSECQKKFDWWRDVYNPERPHKSLGQDVPDSRYQLSSIPFPALLPSIEYGPDDIVRKVHYNGELHFKGNIFHLSKALRGHPVGLRPTSTDGLFDVYLCYQKISTVDLNNL